MKLFSEIFESMEPGQVFFAYLPKRDSEGFFINVESINLTLYNGLDADEIKLKTSMQRYPIAHSGLADRLLDEIIDAKSEINCSGETLDYIRLIKTNTNNFIRIK